MASDDQQNPEPYWRSVDHGHTWIAVPSAPPATLAVNNLSSITAMTLMVLRDGSLLEVSPLPADTQQEALYLLAPGANVWRQASEPLNGIHPLQLTWASDSQGTQSLYAGQQSSAVVGEITWT